MESILQLIGAYEIFTNFIPGAIFVYFNRRILGNQLGEERILFYLLPVIYFIGVVINRIGSIGLNFVVRKLKIISFIDYNDYIMVEQITNGNNKLAILNRVNNLYRTFASMLLCHIFIQPFFCTDSCKEILQIIFIKSWVSWLLFLLFMLSYRKQSKIIIKYVQKIKKTTEL